VNFRLSGQLWKGGGAMHKTRPLRYLDETVRYAMVPRAAERLQKILFRGATSGLKANRKSRPR